MVSPAAHIAYNGEVKVVSRKRPLLGVGTLFIAYVLNSSVWITFGFFLQQLLLGAEDLSMHTFWWGNHVHDVGK